MSGRAVKVYYGAIIIIDSLELFPMLVVIKMK